VRQDFVDAGFHIGLGLDLVDTIIIVVAGVVVLLYSRRVAKKR
jgi:hypothetical protein